MLLDDGDSRDLCAKLISMFRWRSSRTRSLLSVKKTRDTLAANMAAVSPTNPVPAPSSNIDNAPQQRSGNFTKCSANALHNIHKHTVIDAKAKSASNKQSSYLGFVDYLQC